MFLFAVWVLAVHVGWVLQLIPQVKIMLKVLK